MAHKKNVWPLRHLDDRHLERCYENENTHYLKQPKKKKTSSKKRLPRMKAKRKK